MPTFRWGSRLTRIYFLEAPTSTDLLSSSLIWSWLYFAICFLRKLPSSLEEIHIVIVFIVTIKEDPQVLMNLIFTLVAIDHFASPCGLVCGTLVSLLIAFLPSSRDGLQLLRPISLFGGLCPISFAWAILKFSLLKLYFGCSNEYCFILIPKNAILCYSPILQHFKVGKRLNPILSEQVISEVRFVPPVTPGECKFFARCVILCIIKHSLFMFLLLKLLIFCENGVREGVNGKKTFSFGHCPNHLNP